MATPITAPIGIASWALQKMNRDHTGTDTVVEDGINKAKDRPGGPMRAIGGTADLVGDLTGQTWDFDRQGQWFGNQGEAEKGKIGSLAPNYEIIGGQVKAKKNTELDTGEEEGGERVDSKKKKETDEANELDIWNQKVDKLEGVGERGADKQALRKGIFGLSTNMQAGLDNAADIHRQGLASFATIASNLPQYNLPTMSMRTPSFKYFV
jgi:hypothetical protein